MALTARSTQQLWLPKQNWGFPQSILDSEGASEAAALPEEPATASDCRRRGSLGDGLWERGGLEGKEKDVRE